MALIQTISAISVQARIDDAVGNVAAAVTLSEDLKQFSDDNLTEPNRAAGLLTDFIGAPLTVPALAELKARIELLAAFATWANTPNPAIGNATPDRKLRGIRRVV